MTRVSIVIPCFNDGAHLHEAVGSARHQTHDDVEIVVVDDGSSDGRTVSVLTELERTGVRVLHQENQGVSAARNLAIRSATGEYILPLDADDRLAHTYAAHAAAILDDEPEVAIVGSGTQHFGTASHVVRPVIEAPVHWLVRNQLPVSSLFRKSAWSEVGGYRDGLTWGEDWLLWTEIVARGHRVAVLDEVGLHYRQRAGQATHHVAWERQEETRALIIEAGLPIANSFPADFGRLLGQRLNLLEALKSRYRVPQLALDRAARLLRRR